MKHCYNCGAELEITSRAEYDRSRKDGCGMTYRCNNCCQESKVTRHKNTYWVTRIKITKQPVKNFAASL